MQLFQVFSSILFNTSDFNVGPFNIVRVTFRAIWAPPYLRIVVDSLIKPKLFQSQDVSHVDGVQPVDRVIEVCSVQVGLFILGEEQLKNLVFSVLVFALVMDCLSIWAP